MLVTLLFLIQMACAQSSGVLLEIRQKNPMAFSHAEALYQSSSDSLEQARLATLLAFAPEDKVHIKPYVYAAFAVAHDTSLSLDLKLKLMRLAGEGFYSEGQFKKAKTFFITALSLKNLSESDQEYFEYQMAWCDLNLKDQLSAYQRLEKWIETCQTCRLKKDIIKDMGRSLGEAYLSKKPFQIHPLKSEYGDDFVLGFFASFEREKNIDPLKMMAVLPKNFFPAFLKVAFKSSLKACTKVDLAIQFQSDVVSTDELKNALYQCPSEKGALVFSSFGSFSQEDFLLLSEIYKKIGQPAEACSTRFKAAIPANMSANEYLNLLFSVCKNNLDLARLPATPQFYISAISDQSPWLKTYLSAVAENSAVRQEFEKERWILNYNLDETLATPLLEDSRFSVSYRMEMWQKLIPTIKFNTNVLEVLNQDLIKSKIDKTKFVQMLASGPKSAISCLLLTLNDQDSLADCLVVKDLERLTPDQQSQLLKKLIAKYGANKIVESWDHFQSLVDHNDDILLFLSQNSSGLFEKLNDPVSNKIKLAAKLLKFEPVTDSSKDIEVIRKAQSTTTILNQNPNVERAMNESAQALRLLKTHHWSSTFYAQVYKAILKKGLQHFQTQLSQTKGLNQISQLVRVWETRL